LVTHEKKNMKQLADHNFL